MKFGLHQSSWLDTPLDLLINGDYRNDVESRELFASDVMPHFG